MLSSFGTGPRDISATARGRLLSIFGDPARVDALIDEALAALREQALAIPDAIASHDRERLARIAHQIRGIALEIGFTTIGHRASELELVARTRSWDDVIAIHRALADTLRRRPDVVEPARSA